MSPREAWKASFARETALRKSLATAAPEERAELEREIANAAEETRAALLAIGQPATEGRGLRSLRRAS